MCRHNDNDFDCVDCCYQYGFEDAVEGEPEHCEYKNFDQCESYHDGYIAGSKDTAPNKPVLICPCGGQVEYFGEALMGSLTCKTCEESLIGVGWEFIKSIETRWIAGDRGFYETD